MDQTAMLKPWDIKPLHKPTNKRHLDELVESMKEIGWQGRPLLVIRRKSDYVAWTGSHRIAAARKVGLDVVPCYLLDERKLLQHEIDAEWGHCEDRERLEICRKIGDDVAIHLMWVEGRS